MPAITDEWPPDILFDAVYTDCVLRRYSPKTVSYQKIIDQRAADTEREGRADKDRGDYFDTHDDAIYHDTARRTRGLLERSCTKKLESLKGLGWTALEGKVFITVKSPLRTRYDYQCDSEQACLAKCRSEYYQFRAQCRP